MFPEPTELLLIGCLIESNCTPRSKSNTLTPKTNSQTYWPREISHVTNRIIFCVCSTLAISVPPIVLKRCRKEHKKMQMKTSHSKIKADDEFGLAIQRKGSKRACFDCIRKPGENKNWKSNTSELRLWANVKFVQHLTRFKKRKQSQGVINDLDNVDFISSNVHSSRQEALLYVFEDNEAVIKMIIKERSLTMRHVSRTHRVALDWLFDRIKLHPKIQIKYIDTKNQLADILT